MKAPVKKIFLFSYPYKIASLPLFSSHKSKITNSFRKKKALSDFMHPVEKNLQGSSCGPFRRKKFFDAVYSLAERFIKAMDENQSGNRKTGKMNSHLKTDKNFLNFRKMVNFILPDNFSNPVSRLHL